MTEQSKEEILEQKVLLEETSLRRGKDHNINDKSLENLFSKTKNDWSRTILFVFILFMLCSIVFYLVIGVDVNIEIKSRHPGHKTMLPNKQRIVLLAGPHKTSSSSIQLNLYNWLYKDNTTALQETWKYPSIEEEYFKLNCNFPFFLHSKIFYPLLDALRGIHKEDPRTRCLNEFYTRDEIIDLYRNEMRKQWDEGYSLVLASEAMDYIASSNEQKGNFLLDKILDVLPIEKDENLQLFLSITAIVMYRLPRINHLISFWHQCCMKRMSFYRYLMSMNGPDALRSLDSLSLARRFVNQNISTILVDLSGVKYNEYDISLVIACDVLDAKCNTKKEMDVPRKPSITNVKTHSKENLNVTDAKLTAINEIIERYDCYFKGEMKSKHLKILYPYEIDRIMASCSNSTSVDEPISSIRLKLVKEIQEVLKK